MRYTAILDRMMLYFYNEPIVKRRVEGVSRKSNYFIYKQPATLHDLLKDCYIHRNGRIFTTECKLKFQLPTQYSFNGVGGRWSIKLFS